jgi:hypothetical protein
MDTIHAAAAWLAVAAAAGVLLAAVAATVGWMASKLLLDRAILVCLAATGAAALAGLVLPISGQPPRDALHVLYGVVAVGAVPLARYHARRRSIVGIGRWVGVGGLVLMGALLRLFMTGR